MRLGDDYFAAKVNANFPGNPSGFGLPTVQGLLILMDGEHGHPLAVMDSIEITLQRTGAATAVAARWMARPGAGTVTICGCGPQGRVQLRSVAQVCRLRRGFAFDLDPHRAEPFAHDLSGELGLDVEPASDLDAAVSQSDIVITCTTATRFFLRREQVRPGTFVAAVGADNEEKQELEPALLAESRVVADLRAQAAMMGDCHHAITAGLMRAEDIFAELGEIVARKKPGRVSDEEITIFDSTGTSIQDVAASVLVYRRALRAGIGDRVDFAG
jgi:ornithine cyclodeaminase/alanine dehydrogenase-like protein (mu-crystallin family)